MQALTHFDVGYVTSAVCSEKLRYASSKLDTDVRVNFGRLFNRVDRISQFSFPFPFEFKHQLLSFFSLLPLISIGYRTTQCTAILNSMHAPCCIDNILRSRFIGVPPNMQSHSLNFLFSRPTNSLSSTHKIHRQNTDNRKSKKETKKSPTHVYL